MNANFLTLSATAVAAAIVLAGCSTGPGSPGTATPGTNHGSSHSAPASSTPAAAADHNAADVTFAQRMIPHHAQAVEMSDIILAKTDIPAEVTALATRIKAAQGPEIAAMTSWLSAWNEPAEAAEGHTMSGSMEGMMSGEDMNKLQTAQGTEAARLFLTQMIAHHQGAITMATSETVDGQSTDAVALAKAIVSDQEAEIQKMQDLLATL